MPDQDKPGLAQGLADALAASEPTDDELLAEAEQLPLLPRDVERDADGETRVRRPGRPAGSKNRSTEWWARYLSTRFPSPLVGLAAVASRPVMELARELRCKPEDALKIQIDAMKALLPYVHQKQPVAVQLSSSGVVQLVIAAPEPGAVVQMPGEGVVLDLEPVETGNDDKSKG